MGKVKQRRGLNLQKLKKIETYCFFTIFLGKPNLLNRMQNIKRNGDAIMSMM